MAHPSGYNAMRWQCRRDGCFNEKRRPKIEIFADCFPGKINFGDVDGIVELNGRFCLLEWKGEGGQLHTGQRITYERLTSIRGNVVFVVDGNAETMDVSAYRTFWHGRQHPLVKTDLHGLKVRIRRWVMWTQQLRAGTAA